MEHLAFVSSTDLREALSNREIEFLDVDDYRLFAIYGNAVFTVEVPSGSIDAAEEITVELQEGPSSSVSGEQVLEDFVTVLTALDQQSQ